MKKAIILGSSITGLLTAKVLSNHADEVIIVEKDEIPSAIEPRRGVPQGNHVHILLKTGLEIINKVFPETIDLLRSHGANQFDYGTIHWYQHNLWKAYAPSGILSFTQKRPLLDWVLLEQLKKVENVHFMTKFNASKLIYDKDNNQVLGVILQQNGNDKRIYGDLIVDATGRASKTEKWFSDLGITQPEIKKVEVNVKYVSKLYKIPEHLTSQLPVILITHQPPVTSRIGVLAQLEDHVLVTLVGMLGDHPPIDEEGFLDFASQLDQDIIYQLIQKLEPLEGFKSYGYPNSKWKQFHQMKDFPTGYLVVGDAYASLNPIYAQGMTLASLQIEQLADILNKHPLQSESVQKLFYKRTKPIIDAAWQFSSAEDLRFSEVIGDRSLMQRFLNWYSGKIFKSSHNPKIHKVFLDVMNFNKSQYALFNPLFVVRVLMTNLFSRNTINPDFSDLVSSIHPLSIETAM